MNIVNKVKPDYESFVDASKAYTQIIIMTILGLLTAIALGLIIAISISRQLKKVLIVTESLGENDLSKTVDIDNKSEIGSLAKHISIVF